MTKRQLQKDIRQNEGFVFSDGTLNMLHLLTKAYDLIAGYNLRLNGVAWFSKKEILAHFTGSVDPKKSLYEQQYYGEIDLKDYQHGDIAISPYTTWDDIESFFQNIAPSGYYFGSTEGDGACIGWFKIEEN